MHFDCCGFQRFPRMLILALPLLFCRFVAAQAAPPLYLVLFARFETHIPRAAAEQRLHKVFEAVEQSRKEHPGIPVKVVLEFSGTVAEVLAASNPGTHWVDRVKAARNEGWVEVGYSGRHEPTYRNRPRPVLRDDLTPQQRWQAWAEPARSFLADYKDFWTGAADPARAGGMRKVAEVFGALDYAADYTEMLGSEPHYLHQMRGLGLTPAVKGLPDPHFYLNLHGYAGGKSEFSRLMSPGPDFSPEVFWNNDALEVSFTSLPDLRMVKTIEGPEALEKVLTGLERKQPRVVHLEILDEERYFNLWPDGTPRLHPLVWAYDHPENPAVPAGIRAFEQAERVEPTYDKDAATLSWLLEKWIPSHPETRFVTYGDLKRLAAPPPGREIDEAAVGQAAKAFLKDFETAGKTTPGYVQAGEHCYSAGDLFLMLAQGFALRQGKAGASRLFPLTLIYGPAMTEDGNDLAEGTPVAAGEIARIAASLAPALSDTRWAVVPSNAVPSSVTVAGKRLSPAQFLKLMAQAWVAGSPSEVLRVEYLNAFMRPGTLYPMHIGYRDAGLTWTLRPARLKGR